MHVDFLALPAQLAGRMQQLLLLSVPFGILEALLPARRVQSRRTVLRDAAHVLVAIALTIPTTEAVYRWLIFPLLDYGFFNVEPDMPLPCQLFLTLLGIDFSLYWIHRGLHSKLLWSTHRWHHSPREMYWLAGLRASFPHNFLFVANSLVWAVAMRVPPEWVAKGTFAAILSNNWMHTNVRLNARWLETVLITPRAHALHHSRNPQHHHGNFGAFLSIWDRLFGTYVDPCQITEPLEFGLPTPVPVARLIIGI